MPAKKKATEKATKAKAPQKARSINPSELKRFFQCPGSLGFQGKRNPFRDRFADLYGTLAHRVFQEILQTGISTDFSVDFQEIWESAIPHFSQSLNVQEHNVFKDKEDELKEWSRLVFGTIRIDWKYLEDLNGAPPELKLEAPLGPVQLCAGQFVNSGKADAILSNGEKVYIYDFKTGMLEVEAEHNVQLQNYGQLYVGPGAPESWPEVEGCIIQPSLNLVSRGEIQLDPDYFLRMASTLETFLRKSKQAKKARNSMLRVGQECRFCEYAEVCPAFKEQLEQFLKPEFHGEEMSRIDAWKEVLEFVNPTIKALERIKSDALEAARMGVEIPGFEVHFKPAQRKWSHNIPASSFARFLKIKASDAIKSRLESPAQIEKLLKTDLQKQRFADSVSQPSFPSLKYIGDKPESTSL